MAIVDAVMTVMDLAVPGVGLAVNVLRQIYELSDSVEEGKDTCKRMHQRLSDILTELKKMEDNNQLPPSDALNRYAETLHKSLMYLEKYSQKSFVSRMLYQKAMMDEVSRLHEEIDALMTSFSLATNSAMMQWRQEWEEERAGQMAMLARIDEKNDLVLGELKSQREMQEATFLLLSKLKQPDLPAETREPAKKMLNVIVRASGASVPTVPKWFIPRDDLEYDSQPFDRGSFGALHRGTWGSGTQVVVKTLLLDGMEQHKAQEMRAQFLQEAEVWHGLSHPHVVKMFGACHISTPPFIVCEDATGGNLASYFKRRGQGSLWKLLHESALGLEHLHRNRVVHGDLKLNNLLVGADGAARVADFGLSVVRRPSIAVNSQEALDTVPSPTEGGGLRWRAPECFTGQATFASDVYSLAMCMIEAVSGEPPYGYVDDKTVIEKKRNGEIPSQPSECPDEAWKLIVSMTACDPSERAKLEDVVKALKSFVDLLKLHDTLVVGPNSSVGQLVDVLKGGSTENRYAALKWLFRKAYSNETHALEIEAAGRRTIIKCAQATNATWGEWAYACACLRSMCRWKVIASEDIAAVVDKPRKPAAEDISALTNDLWCAVEAAKKAAEKGVVEVDVEAAVEAAELLSLVVSWPPGTIHSVESALVMLLRVGTTKLVQVAIQTLHVLADGDAYLGNQKAETLVLLARQLNDVNPGLRDEALSLMEKISGQIDEAPASDVIRLIGQLVSHETPAIVLRAFELLVRFAVKQESTVGEIEKTGAVEKFVHFITAEPSGSESQVKGIRLLCDLCTVKSAHCAIKSAGAIAVLSEAFKAEGVKALSLDTNDGDILFFALGSLALSDPTGNELVNPKLVNEMIKEENNGVTKPGITRMMIGAAKRALESGQDHIKTVALQLVFQVASDTKTAEWLMINGLVLEPILKMLKHERTHFVLAAKTLRRVHEHYNITARWRGEIHATGSILLKMLSGSNVEVTEALKLLQAWDLRDDMQTHIAELIELLQIDKPGVEDDEVRVLAAGAIRRLKSMDSVTNTGVAEILWITRELACNDSERCINAAQRIVAGAQSHSSPWCVSMAREAKDSLYRMLASLDQQERGAEVRGAAVRAVASLVTDSVKTLPLSIECGVEMWVPKLKDPSTADELMPRCAILRVIANASESNRESIIGAGAVPFLTKLAANEVVDKDVRDVALSIMTCLTNCEKESNRDDVVKELLKMLDSSDRDERGAALSAVVLLVESSVVVLPLVVARGMEIWVSELRESLSTGEVVALCRILCRVAQASDSNCTSMIHAGAVPFLTKLFRDATVDRCETDFASKLMACLTASDRQGVTAELLKMIDSIDAQERGVALRAVASLVADSVTLPLVVARGVDKWVDELEKLLTVEELTAQCKILVAMAQAGNGESLVCSGAVAYLAKLAHNGAVSDDMRAVAKSAAMDLLQACDLQFVKQRQNLIGRLIELLQIDKPGVEDDEVRVLAAGAIRRLKSMDGVTNTGVAEILWITRELACNDSERRINAAQRIVAGAQSHSSPWCVSMAQEAKDSLYRMLASLDQQERGAEVRGAAVRAVASLVTDSVKTLPLFIERGVEMWVPKLKDPSTADELVPRCAILRVIANASESNRESIIGAGAVPFLTKLAANEVVDKDVRDVASSIMTCLTNCEKESNRDDVVKELLKILDATDRFERAIALEIVSRIVMDSVVTLPLVVARGVDKWVDELEKLLTVEELTAQCKILVAMAQAGNGESLVCSGAVAYLAKLAHNGAVSDDMRAVAKSAAMDLLQACDLQFVKQRQNLIGRLIELLQIDKPGVEDDEVRVLAAGAIRRLKSMDGVTNTGVAEILWITRELACNDSERRINAAQRIVAGAQSHSSPWCVSMAREAKDSLYRMLASLDQQERGAEVRGAAVRAVASLVTDSVKTLPLFIECGVEMWVPKLKDPSTADELVPRCAILRVIANASESNRESIIGAGAVPFLTKLAANEVVDKDVRDVASSIMTCLTNCEKESNRDDVVKELLKMLDSSDRDERGAALSAVVLLVESSVVVLPLVVARGVDKWVNELKHTSTMEELLPRCKILIQIADMKEDSHGMIIQAGGVPVLAKLSCDDTPAKNVSCSASSILKSMLVRSYRSRVTEALVKMIDLTASDAERQGGLCGIELCVSIEAAVDSMKSSNNVTQLLKLIQGGTDNEKERAVSILHKIAATKDEYVDTIRDAGGVPVLNAIAHERDSPVQAKAVWTIGALTRRSSIARQDAANLSIVPVLVEMARSDDAKKKESAAFALGSLMKSNAVKKVVREKGGYDVLQTLAKSGSPEQMKYAQRAISMGEPCRVS